MTRLTSKELELLRDEGDWKALWATSVMLVKYTARLLRTDEREDLIQDGLLEVGRQIKNWEPARGKFSTFICNVARTSMLKHIARKNKRNEPVVSLHNETDFSDAHGIGSPVPAPTYRDTGHTPAGFDDPITELARQFSQEAAETLLAELNASDSLILREYFGLPILDDPAESRLVKDIAASRGLPQQTFSSRVSIAQKRLGESLRAGYTFNNMTPHEATYPPEGRKSWCTNLQANRNHVGFWVGSIASAMGDTDAWRESTGAVYNDWSWKPTDEDIRKGAKP